MYIFKCRNKAKSHILVTAPNEEECISFLLRSGFVKKEDNAKIQDITDSYVDSHAERGFTVPSEVGQLYQVISHGKSEWKVLS